MEELKNHRPDTISEYIETSISHWGKFGVNVASLIKLNHPNRIILMSKLNVIINPKLLAVNLKV